MARGHAKFERRRHEPLPPRGRWKAPGAARKPRADAQRNRDGLLEAAKAAFAEVGPEASLDEIARRARVGIGTLYRHFPTRDAIVEAVYRREVQQLADAAPRLIESLPPAEALRAWMRLFIDYIAAKRVIAPGAQIVGRRRVGAVCGLERADQRGDGAARGTRAGERRHPSERRFRRSPARADRLRLRQFRARLGGERAAPHRPPDRWLKVAPRK